MIPIAKNNGSTVFGVRIGLQFLSAGAARAIERCHSLPRLESLLAEGSIYKEERTVSPTSLHPHTIRVSHLLASCSFASYPLHVDSGPVRRSSPHASWAVVFQPSWDNFEIMGRLYPVAELVLVLYEFCRRCCDDGPSCRCSAACF
jgi:hypothetical protein